MMRNLYVTFVFTLCALAQVFGQATEVSCTQRLRTAQATYDAGRLHEVPALLDECLKNNRFTQTENIQANRLLVLTYIYLEEPQKADEAMLKLLNTDFFFKPNEAVDPIEFQNLWKKFRTEPIFSFGFKAGVNTSFFNVMKHYYVDASGKGQGLYKSNLSLQGALFAEIKIPKTKFTFNPEIFYNSASYNYNNSHTASDDPVPAAPPGDDKQLKISQTRLQTNFLVQYPIGESKLAPYVALGPSVNYLMSSIIGGSYKAGGIQTTQPDIKDKENYKTLTYSLIAAAGIKYKVGGFYITADVRYQYGLGNVVNKDNRFKRSDVNDQLWHIGFIYNDFKMSQAMFNVGLIVPYFKPKKLIR